MTDPLIPLVICSALGLLFLVSAVHKVTDRHAFLGALDGYVLVPRAAAPLLAWLIPAVEVIAGGLMIARPHGAGPAGPALCALLLLIYGAAILANIRAGRIYVDCGCLGFGAKRDELKAGMAIRNGVLAAFALAALLPAVPRGFLPLDWISLIPGVAVAALVYGGFETLLTLPRRMDHP